MRLGRRAPVPERDWDEARRRLARAEAALELALSPSPELIRARLDAAARRLAAVPAPARAESDAITVLRFTVGAERYAVEARFVVEVARLSSLTPLPDAPRGLAGATNVRGVALPVADLPRVLGAQPAGITDSRYLLVLGQREPELCLLAEWIDGIAVLAKDQIHDGARPEPGTSFVRGASEDAWLVLDAPRLLADRAFFVISPADPDATRREASS